MLAEEEAIVLKVAPFDLHGVRYYDLAVGFPDRSVQQARLGAESVPDDLQEGDSLRRHNVLTLGPLDLVLGQGPELFTGQRPAGAAENFTGGVVTVDRAHCSLPCSADCVCTSGPAEAPSPVGPGADSA